MLETILRPGSGETPALSADKRGTELRMPKCLKCLSTQDVLAVSSYAPPWMTLYSQLFPSTSSQGRRDQLITKHEDMFKPNVDPIAVAEFLLSFAITAGQVPEDSIALSLKQKGASLEAPSTRLTKYKPSAFMCPAEKKPIERRIFTH